ncbi:MAG: UDP-3-O-(3-hydroxymyristoyl)glucosamine N-acyltransferase [Phycisphaerales bacterium]|nr:UDP-3-O-(3-hydroxymyristoyl)glucosamine N-acyltransferase [Phycisphaerales bacterium]
MNAAGVAPASPGAHPANGCRWTTGELAAMLRADLVGPADIRIARLDALERADDVTLTFIRDARNAERWGSSRAAAAIVSRRVEAEPGPGRALLFVQDADHALIEVLEILTPASHLPRGVSAGASVDPSATVDPTASIGPGAYVGPRAVIGAGASLHANVTVGADVTIGAESELRSGVVVEDRCVIGARVRLHPNCVIGSDGFGYRPSKDGRSLVKIPHAGHVEVGDDAEIGAGTTIDRGKFGATTVGAGTKIDNLVQIGHNCRIGRGCIICGCCALAGSVTVGDGAVLAGGVGVADNMHIGARAKVGARSGVMDNIPDGETWVGYPAAPWKQTMRIVAAMKQLPDLMGEVRRAMKSALGGDANP